MSIPKQKQVEFLKKLNELTRETGIAIAGCGCCGSPFLIEADLSPDHCYRADLDETIHENDFQNITWDKPQPHFKDDLKLDER